MMPYGLLTEHSGSPGESAGAVRKCGKASEASAFAEDGAVVREVVAVGARVPVKVLAEGVVVSAVCVEVAACGSATRSNNTVAKPRQLLRRSDAMSSGRANGMSGRSMASDGA